MENNTWNPGVGTPQEGASQYDSSLNDDFQGAEVQSGMSIPGEPAPAPAAQESEQSDMWGHTADSMNQQEQQQQQLPEIPEAGMPGIDYDMGHIEKIGKSLMVGVGDMVDSFGDIADFLGGTPSNEISRQVFGVETNKPISDTFHDFADYLHSYGDDVPGLTDLQDITWDDLSDVAFWETGVARMLPFALSLMIPGSAAAKGASMLTKGKMFTTAAKAIAAGGRSVGMSSNVANAYNASKLIHTGISTVAAGSTANMIEGAAIAGQAMNEAILQGVDIKDAKHVGRQVFADNLASMGADIIQYGLFAGQLKVGASLMKTAKGAATAVSKTGAGKVAGAAAGKVAGTTAAQASLKLLKNPKIESVIRTAFKSIGMGAANGVTDGVVEQFQEVFQDWTVQRRIAEAKGEEFPSYLEFFTADEQVPTRVLSFATSLLMSGASNMISTATENRALLAQSLDSKAETHQLIDIFNQDIEAGVYAVNKKTRVQEKDSKGDMVWVEKDNIVEMNTSQINMLAKDTAARTILMNAVSHGDSEMIMEFFQAKFDNGSITQEQLTMYEQTLSEVNESVAKYPVNKLNNKEKSALVSHAWFNNVASKSLAQKRGEMETRVEEIQTLVDSKAQTKEWGDKEIAGLKVAMNQSLNEEKKIVDASAQAVRDVYSVADARVAKDKFSQKTAPALSKIVQKEYNGESLTKEESDLVGENESYYKDQKDGYAKSQVFIKFTEHVGEDKAKGYKQQTPNKDGSTDFSKTLENGKIEYINISSTGEVATKVVESAAKEAEIQLEAEAKLKAEEEASSEVKEEEVKEESEEEVVVEEVKEEPVVVDDGYDKMSLNKLKKKARVLGIKGLHKFKKADKAKLIELMRSESSPEGEQFSIRFMKNARASAILAKSAAKVVADKVFDKGHIAKVIDFVEDALIRRRLRRALVVGSGSERAFVDLLSSKAVDGLVSVNSIVDLSKKGINYFGYAAGLSIFLDNSATDETFFHENFHIFRELYSHLPEVQEMMSRIVDQPIYNKVKLQYQENLLYSVPTSAKGEIRIVRQEEALKSLNLQSEEKIETNVEDYAFSVNQKVTLELSQEFSKYASDLLDKAQFKELSSDSQTIIQDEALTQLAGIYGAENKDMFISDETKREEYNNSLKSWKQKISKAFTKEEAEWSLEVASKGDYKKTDEFDLEASLAQVKTLMAKHEAEYGGISKASPSLRKVNENRDEAIMDTINKMVSEQAPEIISDARTFVNEDMPHLLSEKAADGSVDTIMNELRAELHMNKIFNKSKVDLAKYILAHYVKGTKEYNEVYNVMFNNDKAITNFVEQMFLGAVSKKVNDGATLEQVQEMLNSKEEQEADTQEDGLANQIQDKHMAMADKFYVILRTFMKSDKYIGDGSYDISLINKENIMKSIRELAAANRSEPMFRLAAEKAMAKARQKKPNGTVAQQKEMLMGNFFIFMASEIDMSGGNIYQNILLQFNSMTTEKGILISGDGFAPVMTSGLKRKIRAALVKVGYTEEETTKAERTQGEWLGYMRAVQEKKIRGRDVSDSDLAVNEEYKRRLNLSRAMLHLSYTDDALTGGHVVNLINNYLLPEGLDITVAELDSLVLSDEDGNRISARAYFSRDRIKEMFWGSISIAASSSDSTNSMETWTKDAVKNVFIPVFKKWNKDANDEFVNISDAKLVELEAEFVSRFQASFSKPNLDSMYVPHMVKSSHLKLSKDEFLGFSIENLDTLVYEAKFTDGFVDEEDGDSNTRDFFINDNGNVQHVRVKQIKEGQFIAKDMGEFSYKEKKSITMFEMKEGDISSSFKDVQGVVPHAKRLLEAKLASDDDSHNSNIRTPEGEMLNKNIRKYFLVYNKESLNDYMKANDMAFLSLFSFGEKKNLVTNPYAAMIANGTYELEYISIDGDANQQLDRANLDNLTVSKGDISEINRAIKVKSKYYLQPVRDYSDKTRRYYSQAQTITSKREAAKKLKELVQYHENKTKDIIDRHNNPEDVFDMHLTTSPSVIAELRLTHPIAITLNEGSVREGKGELNLLGKKAFELSIDGVTYDLSTLDGHREMADDLSAELDVKVGELASLNYFINKFYLQDITSSIMEEADFTMKNKRATGLIANHDSSYAGERVELLIFEDEGLSSNDMPHKIQVLDYVSEEQADGTTKVVPKTREITLKADLMDSASYITQEEADKLTAKHGDIVDVKGSYKLVGYGKNVDNKKISSFYGQESNTFYAKGHTIVLNNKVTGPLKEIYRALKAREKYYAKKKLRGHAVIAYAHSGVKKGAVKGVEGTPRNKFSIAELKAMTPAQMNSTMNSYSYDKENDIYGYDGRFFGIQGELDKSAKTATAAKQMIANINVFKGHNNPSVSAASDKVISNFTKALTHQYNSELKDLSREDIIKASSESDSTPLEVQAAIEDGKMSTPSLRVSMLKLLSSKIQSIAYKIRTGGTLSLQESDVVVGYEVGSANKIVQTKDSLEPMTVSSRKVKYKDRKGKNAEKTEYFVIPAQALISQHMANELGITQEDVDAAIKSGNEIKFLATRIPASSSGSTIVLRVAGISTKPGNTIAVNPLVSAIIGSDLDGDMLHLNTIKVAKEGEELSKGDVLKNKLTESIMDLFLMPEVQNSLTKELEFGTVSEETNMALYNNKTGSSDIPNDMSMLGAHRMFGQTKGNGKMIGLIAAQNLVFSYLAEGNPDLMFNGRRIKLTIQGQTESSINNNISEDGGGTWYELANWLNLILDDGKNNNRSKFQFVANTGATFVLLIKMGFPPAKISQFLKSAKWAEASEFVYSKTEENRGALNKELKESLKEIIGEDSKIAKRGNLGEMINTIYPSFDLDNMDRVTSLALYHVLETINGDILSMSHFVGLDKHHSSNPIIALTKHHAANKALDNQSNDDGEGMADLVGENNQLFKRNKALDFSLIQEGFENDPYYSGGYGTALVGGFTDEGLQSSNGILAADVNSYKDKKGKSRTSVKGIFKGTSKNKLSTDEEANERMVKALNLVRAAIHSDVDVAADLLVNIYTADLGTHSLSDKYTREMWKELSREEKYGLVTVAVGQFLSEYKNNNNDNKFLEYVEATHHNAFVLTPEFDNNDTFIKENTRRVPMVKFKLNADKLRGEVDFTAQIRIIQKDFSKLPSVIQKFMVANDFVSTGWGTKPGSLLNFFSAEVSGKINETFKSLEDVNVSEFTNDMNKFVVNNTNFVAQRRGEKVEKKKINSRRVAILSYMALFGKDESLDEKGAFKIETKNVGSNDANQVSIVGDNHFGMNEAMTKSPIQFFSSMPEAAMISLFGPLMYKGKVKKEGLIQNASPTNSQRKPNHISTTKFHKVPLYEFEGTHKQYNIGEEMSQEDFVKAKLPSDIDYEALTDEQKESLQYQFEVYKASVAEVKNLFEKMEKLNLEKAKYEFKSKGKEYQEREKELLDEKFNKVREMYNSYMDKLTMGDFHLPEAAQLGLFEGKIKKSKSFKLDELAANPLRRYLEYHFGNNIANKQIADWEFTQGKSFKDEIIKGDLMSKDISDLSMWLSPGDFGRGKPAIAYINKSMKMTHMKYTRNVNLITKEMNSKLNNLFELKFGDGVEGMTKKLWMKYMGLGSESITGKLFENLIDVDVELKEIVDENGEVSYRDGSNISLKSGLFFGKGAEAGNLNRKGDAYTSLHKAEKEYLEMYVTYTSFYKGLIQTKELYAQDRGSSYVPSVTSSRWEVLQKRGLFGMYFQMFRGDQDISDVMITDINPITGESETLDYFSWKSIYMSESSADVKTIKILEDGTSVITRTDGKAKIQKTSMERIVGLERIKSKAKEYLASGEDALGRDVSIGSRVNDLMSLESEESKNRFNHKRSITSAYLATENLHKALRNYVSLFMFQHGNSYFDGSVYKHLHWSKEDREFKVVDVEASEVKAQELMFTGFEDKKQEVDAAIAQLGGGKYFDPHANLGAGKNKRAINYLQKVVKRGLISKERGLTFSDFESEADVANFFVNWTMYVALGLNVPAAIGNVAIGKYNAYRQMGGAKLLKGEGRYWGLSDKKVYDDTIRVKARKMIEEFGILTYRAEEIAEGTGGSSLSSLIFAPMVLAENWIQQAAFLGNLTEEQWNAYEVSPEGDLVLKDGAKPISQSDLAKLERDVVNVQGRGYSETDARMIQLYALSNMTMQFKRWFPTFIRDRFGKEDIDDLGTMRMGSFPAAADFLAKMKEEGKMWNIVAFKKELEAYGEEHGEHKKEAVMRLWRGTHGIVIVAMLLGMAGMASDDEEEDPAAKFMEKLLGDMLLVVNIPKLTYMTNIPAVNTFKNLGQAVYKVGVGSEYKRKSKYGDKGDKNFVSNLAQLLPSPMRGALQNKSGTKRSLR